MNWLVTGSSVARNWSSDDLQALLHIWESTGDLAVSKWLISSFLTRSGTKGAGQISSLYCAVRALEVIFWEQLAMLLPLSGSSLPPPPLFQFGILPTREIHWPQSFSHFSHPCPRRRFSSWAFGSLATPIQHVGLCLGHSFCLKNFIRSQFY